MSDHSHGHPAVASHAPEHAPASSPADFEKSEIEMFDRDDVTAGTAIGRMLAIIFLYTILAMSIAGLWTYRSLLH